MRRFLLTNDDGIAAEGLLRLARAAQALGEVWIAAPDGQRSAASHSITLHTHIDVHPYDYPLAGVHAFSCSGTPADCVRIGSLSLMPEKPDALLSGINFGYNVATDVQYSGTVGAGFEGAFQGLRAIAFSEDSGALHEVTDAYLPELLAELLEQPLAPGEIFNVNFPACPLAECGGILRERTVSSGAIYHDRYDLLETFADGGGRYLVHGTYNEDAEEGTDFRAVMDGFVSVGRVRGHR